MGTIGFNTDISSTQNKKQPWKTDYLQESTIFGEHTFLPIDFGHAKNDNTIVVGSSGTGKTYSFVEPNILQGNANYVITDSKGTILSDIGASLKAMGYDIQVLNLLNLKHSITYNPFSYFKDNLDVVKFADQVISTDLTGQINRQRSNGPFWTKAAATLIQAIIFFVREFLPKENYNMASVIKVFDIMDQKGENINNVFSSLGIKDPNYNVSGPDLNKSIGEMLFDYARKKNSLSLAVQNWDKVHGIKAADETWAGVVGEAGASLTQYGLSEVQNLMATNQLDFSRMLEPKSAIFILYDDSNSTKNFISNNLYAQLFSYLYNESLKYDEQKLPVKIRFFLDDFKNITIPDFSDYLATARSRNLSICMMLQDESQLRAKYGVESPSIIGNCGSYLLTGTIDLQMAKDASERFNMSPLAIRTLPEDNFLVDISGYVTTTKRFDYHNHPNYINKKTDINSLYNTEPVERNMNWYGLAKILSSVPEVKIEKEEYWETALHLRDLAITISSTKASQKEKINAVNVLKSELIKCTLDPNLNDLTKMYKDTKPTTKINVGFDQQAVSDFIIAFMHKYPKLPF